MLLESSKQTLKRKNSCWIYIFFDVKSLFTDVPLDFTLEKMYKEKKIQTYFLRKENLNIFSWNSLKKNYCIFTSNSCIILSIKILGGHNGLSIRFINSKYLHGIEKKRSNTNIKIISLQLGKTQQWHACLSWTNKSRSYFLKIKWLPSEH